MEPYKIENLLEKYFEGLTSLEEEQLLSAYFSQANVAQHLQQYAPLFGFIKDAKNHHYSREATPLQKKSSLKWLSLAATLIILAGIGIFYTNQSSNDLGTFEDPEIAFYETQKALSLVSTQINKGIQSTQQLEKFSQTKKIIFK